ncbi:MAG: RluA family pseudouridine synthase [Tissierellia bacterium]|nr:RluA family pseudouridine synthase [Tissierellia bacterium]
MLERLYGTEPGLRLDLFLSSRMDLSRSQIQKSIEKGLILVDGKKVRKNYLLIGGEEISIEKKQDEEQLIIDMKLDVLYEDQWLAIINKPAGLVVHPGSGISGATLVSGLLATGWPLSDLSGEDRPGIVHRLDKDTSGLLVIAKDNDSHRYLQEEITSRRMKRIYWAIVEGQPKWQETSVEGYLERHPRKPTTYRLSDQGRFSRTYFKLLDTSKGYSLIECELDTGRTHQIRVHLKNLHLPIVGDRDYGSRTSINKAPRQLLHSRRLELVHPDGDKMIFEAPLPEEFQDFKKKFMT